MKAKFEINQHVAVDFGYPGAFGSSKIIGVVQTTGAVKYNVEVVLTPPHSKKTEVTRLYNIEEKFIMSRQEWLDFNQKEETNAIVLDGRLAYTSEQYPDKVEAVEDEDQLSVDVIIDADGKGEFFYFGWYNFTQKEWCMYQDENDNTEIDPKYMTWVYNPLTHPNK